MLIKNRTNVHRLLGILLCFVLLFGILPTTALAAEELAIVRQPQNMDYPEHSVAMYSVQVHGTNLSCTWHLNFNGKDYNISDTSGGIQPWEPYAGETYGSDFSIDGNNYVTFRYFFTGICSELAGSHIYAVISDGTRTVTSDKAYIGITWGTAMPPETNVPAYMEIYKGEKLDLYCAATSPDGSALHYLWYETPTGQLQDIIAVNRGSETGDTLTCDTSKTGTRYYICQVQTENGGSAYTSAIPVTVIERPAVSTEPPLEYIPITFSTKTLPEATVGQKYSARIECSDPKANIDLTTDSGCANNFGDTGLTLSRAGEISGTPSKAGTYSFAVIAHGQEGEGTAAYTLVVKEAEKPMNAESSEPANSDAEGSEANEPETPSSDGSDDAPDHDSSSTGTDPVKPSDAGFPWWGVLLIALASCGIGVGAVLAVLSVKKKAASKGGNANSEEN